MQNKPIFSVLEGANAPSYAPSHLPLQGKKKAKQCPQERKVGVKSLEKFKNQTHLWLATSFTSNPPKAGLKPDTTLQLKEGSLQ